MLRAALLLSLVLSACSETTGVPTAPEPAPTKVVDRPRPDGETVRTLREKPPPVGPTRVAVTVVRVDACPVCPAGETCDCRPALVVSDTPEPVPPGAVLAADDILVWVNDVEGFEVGAAWDMTLAPTGPDRALLVTGGAKRR